MRQLARLGSPAGPAWRTGKAAAQRQAVRPTDLKVDPRETGDWVKVGELIRLLEEDGWRVVRTKGSHRQFTNPRKAGTVTVAGKPSLDIPPGTLNSILKQAGMKQMGTGA